MEILLFSMLLAWGVMRYGVTDLVATAKGHESPRYRERQQRLAQEHERRMARMKAGPTIGQAVAGRIARRIATPKAPKNRDGQKPFARFFGTVWEQSWNGATDRVQTHRERKAEGALPRQRVARATRNAFDRWRHRHRDTGTTSTATEVPPETATERTGPIRAVAERLIPAQSGTEPLPDLGRVVRFPDDTQAGVLGPDGRVTTWPTTDTDEEVLAKPTQPDPVPPATGRKAHMQDNNQAPTTGEITNISSAIEYTAGMRDQFASAVAHADALTARTTQMADWARQSAVGAETSVASITAGEVSGEAVASLQTAHEQMSTAAARITSAQAEFALAQEQFAQTAEAFNTAHAAFQRQSQVAEAYAANPDAGSKQFNTFA